MDGAKAVVATGPLALAATLPKVTKAALRRRGLAHAAFLTDWEAIVGHDLAVLCQPEKLVSGQSAAGEERVLYLRVAGAVSIEVQHLSEHIIERINGHFGYRAVDGLRIRQAPLAPPKKARASRPIGAEEQAEIINSVETITDPELRAALARFGLSLVSGDGSTGHENDT